MLKPKKKISKKEIKEDKLVTTYYNATTWYRNNKKLVSGILTGVVILAIVIFAYVNNVKANNEKATTELGKILPYFDQQKFDVAINGNLQENVRGLQAIVNDYGSTRAGELAKFYLAGSYFALGDYDKALQYYLAVSVSDELVTASAEAGAAACYATKGDHQAAATYYERAALKSSKDLNTPENLFHAAENYAAAGKKEKALDLYRKLKKDFPTSTYAREVDRWIAEANNT
jgi:tetratricopeptide (TPR) repeat protein